MNLDTIISAIPIAVAFALGGVLGMTFADIDLAPPLPIRHRSAWTHGAWAAILLFLLRERGLVYWFAIGFLPAHAWHLVRDMFPEHWAGAARISLYPLGGRRLGGLLSFLWLLAHAVVTLGVWLWLAVSVYERIKNL